MVFLLLALVHHYIVVPYSTMPNAHHTVAFPHNYRNEKIISTGI